MTPRRPSLVAAFHGKTRVASRDAVELHHQRTHDPRRRASKYFDLSDLDLRAGRRPVCHGRNPQW